VSKGQVEGQVIFELEYAFSVYVSRWARPYNIHEFSAAAAEVRGGPGARPLRFATYTIMTLGA